MIRQSSFAASADEMKAVFTGLLWEINGKELSIVGTDTHRLAWVKGQISNNEIINDDEIKGSFIIPARIAIEIARLMQEENCHIQADKNTVFFAFDNIRVNCRVLEGNFPNFRQVIPEKFVTEVQVDSKALRDAADRISLFSTMNDTSSTIHLEIAENVLTIHSRSDIGFGREEIMIRQEGEDINISFNSRYITDVFKVIDGDEVSIQLSGQLSAGVMREKEDEDFLYLVLPVKV
jgi:DNA polymerase-3 subunit beta